MKRDIKEYLKYGLLLLVFLVVLIGGLRIAFRKYAISLDLGDGSAILTEYYSLGTGDISLGRPERKGYRFTGWTGSNGSEKQLDVAISKVSLGDRHYKAHWSKKLNVTCQDWVIDAKGNLVADISGVVDEYLNAGNSSQGAEYKERTIQVKAGTKVNPADWGKSKKYKAYSDRYVYVGNSGKIKVEEDNTIIYRYFYPIMNINFLVDGAKPSKQDINERDIARFNLYLDGEKVASDVYDYYKGIPAGTWYYIELVWVSAEYQYNRSQLEYGQFGADRAIVAIPFTTREGDFTATCKDYIANAEGKRVREITKEVDAFLRLGKSEKKYAVKERKIKVNEKDVIDGEMWGNDKSVKAYHNQYCYAGSSGNVEVQERDITVYRYFYPLLDIRVTIDGVVVQEDPELFIFDVYADDEPIATKLSAFKGGIPFGSTYEIRNIVTAEGLTYVPDESDSGIMGVKSKTVRLNFVTGEIPEKEPEIEENEK